MFAGSTPLGFIASRLSDPGEMTVMLERNQSKVESIESF